MWFMLDSLGLPSSHCRLASVVSTDRGDTLVESITLADPLRYDLALTKNN